jgi:hypothetical protein
MLDLKAKPGCCQEASPASYNFYIPCNAPAVAMVDWPPRDEPAVRMCEACADHNVHNRGGRRRPLTEDERCQ